MSAVPGRPAARTGRAAGVSIPHRRSTPTLMREPISARLPTFRRILIGALLIATLAVMPGAVGFAENNLAPLSPPPLPLPAAPTPAPAAPEPAFAALPTALRAEPALPPAPPTL